MQKNVAHQTRVPSIAAANRVSAGAAKAMPAVSRPPVAQRVLDEDDTDRLRGLITEFFDSMAHPPDQDLQNEFFDELVAGYDAIEEVPMPFDEAYAQFMSARVTAPAPSSSSSPSLTTFSSSTSSTSSVKKEPKESKQEAYAISAEDEALFSSMDLSSFGRTTDATTTTSSSSSVLVSPAPAPAYTSVVEMQAALNTGLRGQLKYKELKAAVLEAAEAIVKKSKVEPLPREAIAELSAATGAFLDANAEGQRIAGQKALPNKRNLEAAEKDKMQAAIDQFRKVLGVEFRRPVDMLETPGATVTKTDAQGGTHTLGTNNTIVTGKIGAAKGRDAHTMSASIYLTKQYGLTGHNAFVAGHLVTKGAGGKDNDENLTPIASGFNQGGLRTPESEAEKMMRANKVLSYAATANYGRAGKDGSLVPFAAKDLEMIPTSITVKVVERGLRAGGDPTTIVDWSEELRVAFNEPVPFSLRDVLPSL
ncbi:hypothetical protein [Dinghuibacter silviterrae]|uniref:Uncharacterized protein n=1 Tax=Dinghuibacter silviterrae TaxID=1539049 RepID=A0A4R8DW99_9BACT|nr:hypothetical protein [Dinghuibacter silviterrae]TDX02346.1 hypothetical protein EDB95_3404 [Dinghuibacter silviterrae]